MSRIVDTDLGRFRAVVDRQANQTTWVWECPTCKEWGGLTEGQWNGTVSVNCAANGRCTYHETHNFGAALTAAMQARILTGDEPTHDEDQPSRWPNPVS